jgi:electron transfer flavoprotein beta subunit
MVESAKGEASAPHPPLSTSPLIVACLDPADLRPAVDPLTGEVVVDRRRADLSASDAAALEYALRAAEAWSGTVLAVAAGPPSVEPVLRQAMTLGAGALRVRYGHSDVDGPEPVTGAELAGEPGRLAQALAAAIKSAGSPALVLCGDRSPTRGIGAVPALLAHHLGAAQALGLVSVEFEQNSLTVLAERRLDGGWRERLRVPAPAVCSVEAAGVRLRRASLGSTVHAAEQTVPVGPAASGPGTASGSGDGGPAPRWSVGAAPVGVVGLGQYGGGLLHRPPRPGQALLVDGQLVSAGIYRLLEALHAEVGELLGDGLQPGPDVLELAGHNPVSLGATGDSLATLASTPGGWQPGG